MEQLLLQIINIFYFDIYMKNYFSNKNVTFQKTSKLNSDSQLGTGPHDIGIKGCLFHRLPHKVSFSVVYA